MEDIAKWVDLYVISSPLQFTRQVKENQLGTNFSCSERIYFWLKCSGFKIQFLVFIPSGNVEIQVSCVKAF